MKRVLTLLLIGVFLVPGVYSKSLEELGAYYRSQHRECEVKDGRFKEKVINRLVILNKRGDRYNQVGTSKPPSAMIKGLKATVYDSDGKKIYVRKGKDFLRAKGYGAAFELYNDVKIYQTECAGPGYPYLIELEYELEYNTLFFWRGAWFQQGIPVDTCDYILKIRSDLPYATIQGELVPKPTQSLDGDWKILKWHATDIPAFEWDAFVPGLNEPAEIKFVAGKLDFASYELSELSWDGIGEWYRRLAADRYLEGAERSPSGPAPENAGETARQIYRGVIDNSRYVAVSIGLSGWQPAAAEETATCSYGDCKGLSTLLISRLRLAGIPAYPVLVLTRDQGKIDPGFPEFGFNHVIAVAIAGEDTLWMDPTCSTCPFGEIPRSDEDIPVLLITDESGTIVSTPASRPDDNLVVSRSAVEIQANGYAKIVTEIASRGNQAQTLRHMLPHVERGEEKRFYDMLLGNSVGTDLVSYRYEHLTEIDSPLVIFLTTSTTRPLQEIEGCRYVGLPLIQDPYRRMMRDFDNSRPAVDLSFPRRLIDSVTIVVADGGPRSYATPDSAFATSPFATACISGTNGGDGAAIVFERANNGYRVTSDQFEALTEFCAEISKMARTAIAVCGK